MSKLALSNTQFCLKLSMRLSKHTRLGTKPNFLRVASMVVSNIVLNMYMSFNNGNWRLYASNKIQNAKK